MQDDEFEWDDAKAAGNLRKHKVAFEDARLVFADAFAIERIDDRADYGEHRSIVIGMANRRLLVVVFAERGGRIRIISARRADKRDSDDYYQNQASE